MSRRGCRLCHHVLLTLVQPHLAQRHGSDNDVDPCSDETVYPHLRVQVIDVLRREFIVADVFLSERDILNENGRLGAKEDPQHRQHYNTPDADDYPAGSHLRPAEQQRRHGPGSAPVLSDLG